MLIYSFASIQEYYEEEEILELYTTALTRILITLDDAGADIVKNSVPATKGENAAAVTFWPPWPWPPWGDDDDDEKPHLNKSEKAHELAKEVVYFERRLANASLDLYATLFQYP